MSHECLQISHDRSKINMENRFKFMKEGDDTLITVDCTDCDIEEIQPFKAVYWSHKSNHAAFKYEVAVSIRGGDIVWVSGPWPAAVSDKKIFALHLAEHLGDNEFAEVDNGYSKTDKAMIPGAGESFLHKKLKSQARGRQENFNGWLKVFCILKNKFRKSDPTKHYIAFNAVAILVQLGQENGERMYELQINGTYT